MLEIARHFHDGMRACVRMSNGMCSDRFDVGERLRQECNLTALLFNLFFAAMLIVFVKEFAKDDEVTMETAKIKSLPGKRGKVTMAEAAKPLWGKLHADNTGIVRRSPESLEKIMSTTVRISGWFGPTVSKAKTKIICLLRRGM